jgi:hypothetical protein
VDEEVAADNYSRPAEDVMFLSEPTTALGCLDDGARGYAPALIERVLFYLQRWEGARRAALSRAAGERCMLVEPENMVATSQGLESLGQQY